MVTPARRPLTAMLAVVLASTILVGIASPTSRAQADLWAALRTGGHIVLLRHALAPGSGDPSNFRLDDCATQRNLSDRGRAQARRIGEAFREQRVAVDAVYSSRWCRCLETAELLELGAVRPLDALNSQMNLGSRQVRALAAAIAERGAMRPTAIYVTHSSNIRGIVGERARSAEAIVARVESDGTVTVIGSLGVL